MYTRAKLTGCEANQDADEEGDVLRNAWEVHRQHTNIPSLTAVFLSIIPVQRLGPYIYHKRILPQSNTKQVSYLSVV